jgi:hypothetical protein
LNPAAFALLDLTRSAVGQRMRGWSEAPSEEDLEFLLSLFWKGVGR